MPFDPARLLALPPRETRGQHHVRDVQLYALGCGAGVDDPCSAETLALAYERDLRVLPTMASVLAWPGFWMMDPAFGIDWRRVLHAEQAIRLHSPLPIQGETTSVMTIDAIVDKGAEKGAILHSTRAIRDAATQALIATERRATFLRGDGGKGGGGVAPAPLPVAPDREPDDVISLRTRPETALLYRLSGDLNPLHIDPEVARSAGFDRPILHGLATYGVAGRALVRALCDGDPTRLTAVDARFSAPVYPSETIVTEIWRLGDGQAAFRASVAERGLAVLVNGRAEYG